MAADSEFADYLTMESFFNAETLAQSQQQNFSPQQQAQNGDYLMANLVEPAPYNYEHLPASQENGPNKFEYQNNNNNVQYFFENNNSVQQQLLQQQQQQQPEFYVS